MKSIFTLLAIICLTYTHSLAQKTVVFHKDTAKSCFRLMEPQIATASSFNLTSRDGKTTQFSFNEIYALSIYHQNKNEALLSITIGTSDTTATTVVSIPASAGAYDILPISYNMSSEALKSISTLSISFEGQASFDELEFIYRKPIKTEIKPSMKKLKKKLKTEKERFKKKKQREHNILRAEEYKDHM